MRAQSLLLLGLTLSPTGESAVDPNKNREGFQLIARTPGYSSGSRRGGGGGGAKGGNRGGNRGGQEEDDEGLPGSKPGSNSNNFPGGRNGLSWGVGIVGGYNNHDNNGNGDDDWDGGSSSNPPGGGSSSDSSAGNQPDTDPADLFPNAEDGGLNINWGGGWNGWGAGKDRWGKWGSQWDWGNWANGVVPFAIPGTPPQGNDGESFGKVVDASARKWKLQIQQCGRASGTKCIHPLATYHVQGADGSLRVDDGKSWSIDCTFSTTILATSYDDEGEMHDITGFAYNTPTCTKLSSGEPIYMPKQYIWSGDMHSYPDDFTSENSLRTTQSAMKTSHHKTATRTTSASNSEKTSASSQSPIPSKPRSTHAPTTTKRESHTSSTPVETASATGVKDRRFIHNHTTTSPETYTTTFNPDNFIKLTITSEKSELSSACHEWVSPVYSTYSIGGPGGWAGYGGWGGVWGQKTRQPASTEIVTVEVTVTTNGHVTTTPTLVQEQRATEGVVVVKSSGSGVMIRGGAGLVGRYMLSVMTATAVGLLIAL